MFNVNNKLRSQGTGNELSQTIFYSVTLQFTDPDCYMLVTMSKKTTTFPTTTSPKTTTEESFSA